MADVIHIVVEKGPDKGMQITIPQAGARLGRSSKNDIVLEDPILSRHHCRISFNNSNILTVSDLGSANGTIVNDKPITNTQLAVNDTIQVGDSILRVINNGASTTTEKYPSHVLDLGLSSNSKPERKKIGTGPLITLLIAMVLIGLAVWIPKLIHSSTDEPKNKQPVEPPDKTLEVFYEKIEADTNNIFRYSLKIDKNRIISIEIDDLANNRRVRREEEVSEKILSQLRYTIENDGFYTLNDEYRGISPDVLDQWTLSVVIGKRCHNTIVVNRIMPDLFKKVVDDIEEFGKNQLGLWAIPFSTERLLEMAQTSYLLGKKLYNEREIKDENLYESIKAFKEADWYLETVDPKPDYYADMMTQLQDSKDELDRKFKDIDFSVQRAIKLKEWDNAAKELHIILSMIPNSSDERNAKSRTTLLEVEHRIEALKNH